MRRALRWWVTIVSLRPADISKIQEPRGKSHGGVKTLTVRIVAEVDHSQVQEDRSWLAVGRHSWLAIRILRHAVGSPNLLGLEKP